jgi:hypothetical protein
MARYNITQKMGELVKESSNKYVADTHKKIAAANEIYNKLVSNGIVKKRGYTLRGIEDIHLLQIRPN